MLRLTIFNLTNLRLAILLSIMFAFEMSAQAQTNVSGGIYNNATWTVANSPYIMTGPIVVFPGKTLTIEPGVVVRIKGSYDGSAYANYLEIRGTLNMVGTASAPIIIRDDSTTTLTTWRGIFAKTSQGGNINADYFELSNTLDGLYYESPPAIPVTYNYCKFRYSNTGISPSREATFNHCLFEGNGLAATNYIAYQPISFENCTFLNNNLAISTVSAPLSIDSCTFTNNLTAIFGNGGISFPLPGSNTAVWIRNSSFEGSTNNAIYSLSTATIENCRFINNGNGIMDFSFGTVRNCEFDTNGLGISAGQESIVENNTFTNSQTGVAIINTSAGVVQPVIQFNRICNNSLYAVDNRTDLNLELGSNCFCSQDSAFIESKINDGYDDITRGLLNYTVYAPDCQTVILQVIKVVLTNTEATEKTVAKVDIFPNPVQTAFTIQTESDLVGARVQIIDSRGSLITNQKLTTPSTSIDAANWSAGVYFVQIISDSKIFRYKLVK